MMQGNSPDWKARTVLPALARDLSQSWWRLALTDLVIKAISFAIITPIVAVLLRWFLVSGGSTGVVTDQGILFFFLSPVGALTLLVVGSLTLAIYFDEIGALLAIYLGARQGARIWPRGAISFTFPSFNALARLALRVLLRAVLIVAPFLALAGGVYALLLTRYDIYFYLNVRPPEFWIAATLIGAILAAGAFFLLRRLLRWSFAIPILLFEDLRPREALRESDQRMRSRLFSLAAWHAGWLAAGFLLSGAAAAILGLAGRALIRPDAPLAIVAAGIAVVGSIALVAYLATLVFGTVTYAALLGRLYEAVRPETVAEGPFDRFPRLHELRWRPVWERLGWTLAVGAGAAFIALSMLVVNRVRIDTSADVTAHRGAKYEAPENTIAAVERAIELGADWVEIDVQLTADDQVIVAHDRDFNRVAGSSLRVEESTLAELRALDVGAWFEPEFRGIPPPTFGEILETSRDRVGVNVELKYFGPDRGLAERVIQIVEEHGMAEQVMLMSFEHDRILEAKALRPDWKMGLLLAVTLGNALRLEADYYAVPPSLATRRFIRAAHRRGRDVHVWVVDDPVRMSAMLSRGADNVYTGWTTVARRVLAERAAMGPIERLLIDLAADLGVVRMPARAQATEDDG
jgi:glycerophosphoryl diester phosphodiesterase